jgi:RNA polymerase sigma-70 factor (ECF subfamily)
MSDERFEEIYNLYKLDVYRLAFSYTQNQTDAEDITQKAFIKLYNNLEKVKVSEEKLWLLKVTANEFKNFFNLAWNKKKSSISIEDLNISREEKDYLLLYSSLQKVPKKYRICIHLHYFYGYNINEMADILNMNINTVKTRLLRAKQILKLEMEGTNDEKN